MSQLDQDKKNAKTFSWITIVAFILVHVVCFIVSDNKFGLLKATPALIVVNIAAIAYLVFMAVAVKMDAWWATQNYWPGVVLVVLTFASCLMISYCPTC